MKRVIGSKKRSAVFRVGFVVALFVAAGIFSGGGGQRTTLFSTIVYAAEIPADTALRMQEVTKKFVKETGQQVIAVGSWVNGEFIAGKSDCDLRCVLPRGVSKNEALKKWGDARRTMIRLMDDEFGGDSMNVRKATNFYPPSQLMGGIEDSEDALKRYKELKRVPNLGYTDSVEKAGIKHAEGLYGEGSKVWLQEYEKEKGRLFYRIGEDVFTGTTNRTHMNEGLAVLNTSGMGNTAQQWAEHADDELKALSKLTSKDLISKKGQSVEKYLSRLKRDLGRARDLGNLKGDSWIDNELGVLTSDLKKDPENVIKLTERINYALGKAKFQTRVLKVYGKIPGRAQQVIGAMISDLRSDSFSRWLGKASEKGLSLENSIKGAVVIFAVYSTTKAAGENGRLALITELAPELLSLGPQLLAQMTNMIIESAKDAGYAFAASTQDPWDLMAGIYTSVGRHSLDSKHEYNLEDLVRHIHTEEKLSNLVLAKAMLSTARKAGIVVEKVDEATGMSAWKDAYPVILDAWLYRLDELYMEFDQLTKEFQTHPVLLTYSPSPAIPVDGKVTITANAGVVVGQLLDKLKRMQEILNQITRNNDGFVDLSYRWSGGKSIDESKPWLRQFTFEGKGPHIARLTLGLSVGSDKFTTGMPLKERFNKLTLEATGEVDVVMGAEVPTPVIIPGQVTTIFDAYMSDPTALWLNNIKFAYPPGQSTKKLDKIETPLKKWSVTIRRLYQPCPPYESETLETQECAQKTSSDGRTEFHLMSEKTTSSFNCFEEEGKSIRQPFEGKTFSFAIPDVTLSRLNNFVQNNEIHMCSIYSQIKTIWQSIHTYTDSKAREHREENEITHDIDIEIKILLKKNPDRIEETGTSPAPLKIKKQAPPVKNQLQKDQWTPVEDPTVPAGKQGVDKPPSQDSGWKSVL